MTEIFETFRSFFYFLYLHVLILSNMIKIIYKPQYSLTNKDY